MSIFKPVHDEAEASDFRTISASEMAWQEAEEPGFWMKPLFDDEKGTKTLLMRVDEGAYVGPHAHDEVEQVFVLYGSFYDQVRTYFAGDFVERQPGTVHATGSETGATVLLVFTQP